MLVLKNAQIYTLDRKKPKASALAIENNRIIAVGDDQEIISNFLFEKNHRLSSKLNVWDLQGHVVVPGLTDAHIHLEQYALGLQKIDCETATRQECLQRVADRAGRTPAGAWILGHGWNQNNWPEGFGSAADLDAVGPDHPVFLTAKSLHAAWANSAALRLANVSDATPDPPGGRLGRTNEGKLNGILFENAMELMAESLPTPGEAEVAQAIQSAQPILWRMGLTAVHAAAS